MELQQYCRVRIVADIPDLRLSEGDGGYVVEVFEATPDRPAGYMVELYDDHPLKAKDASCGDWLPVLEASQLEVIEPPRF